MIKNNEQVKYSKSNKNVRLHFLDIRDHLGLFNLINIIKDNIGYYFKLLLKDKKVYI